MKNLKILLLSTALACSTLIVAEDLPDRGPVSFGAYDTNGDGIVNKGEFNSLKERRMNQKEEQGRLMRNAYMSPAFEDVDTNKDGKITKDELRIHQQTRLQDRTQDRLQDKDQDRLQDRDRLKDQDQDKDQDKLQDQDRIQDRDTMGTGSGGAGGSGGNK